MFCSSTYGSATAVGSPQSALMVSMSDDGSLDTTQWSFVLRNYPCGKSSSGRWARLRCRNRNFFTLSKCGRGWLRNFAGGTGGFTVSVSGCLSSGGSGGAGAVRELAGKMLG